MSEEGKLVVEHLSDKSRTVAFTVKRSDGNYGSNEATVYYNYLPGETDNETAENAARALAVARDLAEAELEQSASIPAVAHGPRFTEEQIQNPSDADAERAAEILREAFGPPESRRPRLTVEREWDKHPVPDWLYQQAAAEGVTSVVDKRRFHPDYDGPNKPGSPYFQATDGTKDKNDKYAMGFWPPKGEEGR